MSKVQIAIPHAIKDEFLRWLQDQELLHIVENGNEKNHGDISPSHTPYYLAQLQFGIEFLEKVRKEFDSDSKLSWYKRLLPKRPIVAPLHQLDETLHTLNLDEVLTTIKKVSDELAEVSAKQHELQVKIAAHEPWQNLHIVGNDLKNTRGAHHTLIIIGSQEEEHLYQLLSQLSKAAWQVVDRKKKESSEDVYIEIVVHPEEAPELAKAITTTKATQVTLDLREDLTIAQQLEVWKQEEQELTKEHEQVIHTAKDLLPLEEKLQFAYDALLNKEQREKLEAVMQHSQFVSLVTGWMPTSVIPDMKQYIDSHFKSVTIQNIEPLSEEKVPVYLQNSRFMQPFEAVTNIYGKPGYTEIDPSSLLSIFFLIAFGFALTDAGYGILIMIGTFLAEKFVPIKRETRKMVRLLFYGGAMTVVLGALTGGWFGIVLENLPPSIIKDFLLAIKVIDPVTEPLRLLIIALGIGVIQLLFATLVQGYNKYKKKDFLGLVVDDVAWILLILGIFFWVAIQQNILSHAYVQIALWWIGISAGVMIIFAGRAYKNIFLRFGGGLLSLYGLLGFLSDVLSYSRLLALGLATGIIGLVVNLIGGMVADLVPGVGFLLAAIVLIGGHLANLGINALGAFIHGSRLQFVEFFPKFLEGGGLAYRPFGRITKYVDNPKDY